MRRLPNGQATESRVCRLQGASDGRDWRSQDTTAEGKQDLCHVLEAAVVGYRQAAPGAAHARQAKEGWPAGTPDACAAAFHPRRDRRYGSTPSVVLPALPWE